MVILQPARKSSASCDEADQPHGDDTPNASLCETYHKRLDKVAVFFTFPQLQVTSDLIRSLPLLVALQNPAVSCAPIATSDIRHRRCNDIGNNSTLIIDHTRKVESISSCSDLSTCRSSCERCGPSGPFAVISCLHRHFNNVPHRNILD